MCRRSIAGLTAAAIGAAGCQVLESTHDQPARIINADTGSRVALQQTVNAALGTHVILSDSALTDSSLLTIENRPPATMENPVPQGRDMQRPIQFRLVRNGERCVLIRQSDHSRYILNDTNCTPE